MATLEAGQVVLHYRLIEKLGQGGMGVVWKAEDTRLRRSVALKFVSDELRGDRRSIERHLQEARAASAIDHPHICAVHDIGVWEGRPFLVLELLEGQSLLERIGGKPLDLETAIELGSQIADALDAAHGKGIVHRDVKSANIFITDRGRAKMLDFGLARLTAVADDATRTSFEATTPGTVAGTVAYMSPEQALGKPLDARTDIFSFGVVLYEMITGRRAFGGSTTAELFDAILNRAPTAPVELNPEVPAELVRIVDKALEKDRALRYQSAAELRADLERLRRDAAAPVDRRKVVAVLPFTLHHGNEEDAFLSLALAEAVSHELSRKAELLVRPTSAVLRYAAEKADPQRVARELGADLVVEGSVQKVAANLRVQVQAWEAATRSTLLSAKIDGTMDDLFGLQDRSAEALSRGLGIRSDSTPHRPPTADPRAYELYLRAGERLLSYGAQDMRRGIEMLRSAVELDPAFADGWAKLSVALANMAAFHSPGTEWYAEAERAIGRALDLQPENVEAWVARGRILWSPHHGFRNADSLRVLKRACSHTPHPVDAELWLAVVLAHVGLHRTSVRVLEQAYEGLPDDLLGLLVKGEALGWDGDHGAFQDLMSRAIRQDPSFVYGHLFLPVPLVYRGELDEAERAIRSAKVVSANDALLITTEALLWARRGEKKLTHEALERAAANRQSVSHLHHAHHYAACAHALLGEAGKAIEHLEAAVATGFPNYVAFSNDPHLDPLREEDRFLDLLEKLRSVWEGYRGEFGEPPFAGT